MRSRAAPVDGARGVAGLDHERRRRDSRQAQGVGLGRVALFAQRMVPANGVGNAVGAVVAMTALSRVQDGNFNAVMDASDTSQLAWAAE